MTSTEISKDENNASTFKVEKQPSLNSPDNTEHDTLNLLHGSPTLRETTQVASSGKPVNTNHCSPHFPLLSKPRPASQPSRLILRRNFSSKNLNLRRPLLLINPQSAPVKSQPFFDATKKQRQSFGVSATSKNLVPFSARNISSVVGDQEHTKLPSTPIISVKPKTRDTSVINSSKLEPWEQANRIKNAGSLESNSVHNATPSGDRVSQSIRPDISTPRSDTLKYRRAFQQSNSINSEKSKDLISKYLTENRLKKQSQQLFLSPQQSAPHIAKQTPNSTEGSENLQLRHFPGAQYSPNPMSVNNSLRINKVNASEFVTPEHPSVTERGRSFIENQPRAIHQYDRPSLHAQSSLFLRGNNGTQTSRLGLNSGVYQNRVHRVPPQGQSAPSINLRNIMKNPNFCGRKQ